MFHDFLIITVTDKSKSFGLQYIETENKIMFMPRSRAVKKSFGTL